MARRPGGCTDGPLVAASLLRHAIGLDGARCRHAYVGVLRSSPRRHRLNSLWAYSRSVYSPMQVG
eukprot:3771483-Prymnesium_polylepis.2